MADLDARIEELVEELCKEGLLNDQFQQLMQLEDESNPSFVQEVIALYFDDSAQKLQKLTAKLSSSVPEFGEVDALVHQFKGSSASFGAQSLATICVQMREACQSRDQGRCQALLGEAKLSYAALRDKLQIFLQLEQERKRLAGQQY